MDCRGLLYVGMVIPKCAQTSASGVVSKAYMQRTPPSLGCQCAPSIASIRSVGHIIGAHFGTNRVKHSVRWVIRAHQRRGGVCDVSEGQEPRSHPLPAQLEAAFSPRGDVAKRQG